MRVILSEFVQDPQHLHALHYDRYRVAGATVSDGAFGLYVGMQEVVLSGIVRREAERALERPACCASDSAGLRVRESANRNDVERQTLINLQS